MPDVRNQLSWRHWKASLLSSSVILLSIQSACCVLRLPCLNSVDVSRSCEKMKKLLLISETIHEVDKAWRRDCHSWCIMKQKLVLHCTNPLQWACTHGILKQPSRSNCKWWKLPKGSEFFANSVWLNSLRSRSERVLHRSNKRSCFQFPCQFCLRHSGPECFPLTTKARKQRDRNLNDCIHHSNLPVGK